MEKLKADFAQLQTEVAKMRSELDDVDKFFAVYQSLKKNVDNKLQLVVNKVNELPTAFDSLKSQAVKQQVSIFASSPSTKSMAPIAAAPLFAHC